MQKITENKIYQCKGEQTVTKKNLHFDNLHNMMDDKSEAQTKK